MTLSERLLKLIESINRSGYDFLIDMFANSSSPVMEKAYNIMKTQEKNAQFLFDTQFGLNMGGIMWYISAWYLLIAYRIISDVYSLSIDLKNDPEYSEELSEVPIHKVLFNVPEDEISGDKTAEFFVYNNKEYQAIYKKFVGRYKMFFGKDLTLEDGGSISDFEKTMKDFKKELNEYMSKIEHYKNFQYRLIDMFNYMKDGKPLSISEVLEQLSMLEERHNAKNRDPLDERKEVEYWKENGVEIDTEFIVFNEKPMVKWVLKPVQVCRFESDYGKNCGNNIVSNGPKNNYFVSLRRKAEKDDVRTNVTPYDWDIIATADFDPENGLMAGCKGLGFNVNRQSGSNFATPNGNLKPSKELHKYYMALWARPEIRGFYSDSKSGHAPQINLRPRDLSESEMEELEKMILETFKKTKKVDKFKYVNFFGEEKALKNKIVKNNKELSEVMKEGAGNI